MGLSLTETAAHNERMTLQLPLNLPFCLTPNVLSLPFSRLQPAL
jgi:hypothetical protein